MEREMKFKAWDKKNKCWLTDKDTVYLNEDGQAFVLKGTNYAGDYLSSVDVEILQFTGLKDANGTGVDVYEGDIFECVYKDCPDGFSIIGREPTVIKTPCTVVFKWGKFMVEMMHPQYKRLVYSDLSSFLENEQKVVIRNIFTQI